MGLGRVTLGNTKNHLGRDMVRLPEHLHGWMYFSSLDGLHEIAGVFTLAWRFKDETSDPWTKRLNSFKFGDGKSTRPAGYLLAEALKELTKELNWVPTETGLLPALSSSDTYTLNNKPLPKITKFCSESLGAVYLPSVLTKSPHPALHKASTAAERRDALATACYKASSVGVAGLKRILIVDDFVTRGDTLSAVARAIHVIVPHVKVYGIALGKTESKSYAQGAGEVISNDVVPQRWLNVWERYA